MLVTHLTHDRVGSMAQRRWLRWVALAMLAMLFSGCSIVLATRQPSKKDLSVLDEGSPRSVVVAELGEPAWTGQTVGGRTDVFVFKQGYSKGTKAARAILHGAADLLTLGLWEAVGTPTELYASGKPMKVEVIYGVDGRIDQARFFRLKSDEPVVLIPPTQPLPKGPTVVSRGSVAEERGRTSNAAGPSRPSLYADSYALVVGINKYPESKWRPLSYALHDAAGMAAFLERQGFKVTTLYNEQATKEAIIYQMQNVLAPMAKKEDRILVFFAGHGYTERLGGSDFGYIVPYDGKDYSASYVSMEELRSLSRKMGTAKHQLFVIDACYGGRLATRGSGLPQTQPYYLKDVTGRVARQILSAGGKDQTVVDDGPLGYSYFTGYLLEALQDGKADLNGDGYIVFPELATYLLPRATNEHQTPAVGELPGHGLGEFVFRRLQ